MIQLTPLAFIETVCPKAFAARVHELTADHHYTGPLEAQQTEGQGAACGHEEGLVLAALAYEFGGPVLETGADTGVSTRYIHEGLDRAAWPDEHYIYSVDILHKWHICTAPWPRRVRIDGSSFTYNAPEPCAWAFIDGDHREAGVRADIATALRAGCKRMFFHDTGPHCQRKPLTFNGGSDARDVVLDLYGSEPALYDMSSKQGVMFLQLR